MLYFRVLGLVRVLCWDLITIFFLFIVLSGWDVIPFFLFDVSDITSVVLIIVMCLICDLGCVLYQLDVKNSRQKGELGCERLRANAVVFRQLTF